MQIQSFSRPILITIVAGSVVFGGVSFGKKLLRSHGSSDNASFFSQSNDSHDRADRHDVIQKNDRAIRRDHHDTLAKLDRRDRREDHENFESRDRRDRRDRRDPRDERAWRDRHVNKHESLAEEMENQQNDRMARRMADNDAAAKRRIEEHAEVESMITHEKSDAKEYVLARERGIDESGKRHQSRLSGSRNLDHYHHHVEPREVSGRVDH